jgi:hypothetical protein
LILQYEARVLSRLEYKTAAWYHASDYLLRLVDGVQESLAEHVGVSAKDLFLNWNLAPLSDRRDMAMLGMMWKVVVLRGNPVLGKFLRVQPGSRWKLLSVWDQLTNSVTRRSLFGLIEVWNELPEAVVAVGSVSTFQAKLQALMRFQAEHGFGWRDFYSTRDVVL